MNAADTERPIDTEADRVTCWRATELIRAGYEPEAALELAGNPQIDLHYALELVARGCSPELASRILL